MIKSQIGELPKFFDKYISLTEDIELKEGLLKFSPEVVFSDFAMYQKIGDDIYAPGKWTIKDILQHCIDTERIMAYRALCFARNEEVSLPGFDEESYAKNTNASSRTMADLMEEFIFLRKSTCCMFDSFDKTMLLRKGSTAITRISPLALGFVIIGHSLHHEKIIRERYYNI
jgi:hypothetical protein